jgi:hypothetical protein
VVPVRTQRLVCIYGVARSFRSDSTALCVCVATVRPLFARELRGGRGYW